MTGPVTALASDTSSTSVESAGATLSTAVATPELIQTVNDLMITGFEIAPESLIPSARLKDDLGLDSLDAVDMLVHIEEKMDLKVDGEKVRSLRTLADVYALAADAMANKDA